MKRLIITATLMYTIFGCTATETVHQAKEVQVQVATIEVVEPRPCPLPKPTIPSPMPPKPRLSEKDERGIRLFNDLVSEGLPPLIAAGIVGNVAQESDFLPHIASRSGVGYVQWCGYRRHGLRKFASIHKTEWTDPVLQAKWIRFELKEGTEKEIYPRLLRAGTPEEAASLVCDLYERPSKRTANKSFRIAEARRFHSLWKKVKEYAAWETSNKTS